MGFRARGPSGTLRWGYQTAAELKDWAIESRGGGAARLRASVVTVNKFRASQRPLNFETRVHVGTWTWPIVELQITGASLEATLGPRK